MRLEHKLRMKNMDIVAYIWIIVVVILIGYTKSSFATFRETPQRCDAKHCWEITGVISQSDLQGLFQSVELIKEEIRITGSYESPMVFLNSDGGDVEAAIAIGRQLRKFHASVFTWENGRCYSSCVFILAGGVNRYLSNTIGIHRPYSLSTDARSLQTIQVEQRRIAKLAKDYLEEVNVLPSLYDAMVSIPPESIQLLSASELQSYGLLKEDPAEQEMSDAFNARKYRLSKVEYLRRKVKVDDICASGDINDYANCRDAIFRSPR